MIVHIMDFIREFIKTYLYNFELTPICPRWGGGSEPLPPGEFSNQNVLKFIKLFQRNSGTFKQIHEINKFLLLFNIVINKKH